MYKGHVIVRMHYFTMQQWKGKSSVSMDWPSLDMDSGMGTDISDLPKPLLSMSEAERAAAHQLFDKELFVMDRNSTESKADEWPDLK